MYQVNQVIGVAGLHLQVAAVLHDLTATVIAVLPGLPVVRTVRRHEAVVAAVLHVVIAVRRGPTVRLQDHTVALHAAIVRRHVLTVRLHGTKIGNSFFIHYI